MRTLRHRVQTLTGLLLSFVWATLMPDAAAQVTGYYRFPAIHGNTIVFTAEGDLWRVPTAGGPAFRLTTHPGEETFPVISPDGQRVAFAATYEGAPEVYVMPLAGGFPQRVTWYGSSSTAPVAWTADGRIVYRTTRLSTLPNTQLEIVDPESFLRASVELDQAADGSFGPDGTLYFTRLPRQRSNARWYKGGTAQNIWRLVPAAESAHPLTTDWAGTSKNPIWFDGRVYFLSDRAGRGMNVWSITPDGEDLRPHTFHQDWDVQEHALSAGTLVYRLGADLWKLDLASGESYIIPITLVSDVDQRRETWEDKPSSYLTSAHVSPTGDRIVLTARGEVFVTPVKTGRLVHVSRDSGIRHRSARFAPDGKHLLTLSDASGEIEWWRLPADGVGDHHQVSKGPALLKLPGDPSPDGRWIVHSDYGNRLWLLDTRTGDTREIAASSQWASQGITYAWSPDSRYVAYSIVGPVRMSALHLYDTQTDRTTALSSERFEDWNPVWSPNGAWLYFLSNRIFETRNSVWEARAAQPSFSNQTVVLAFSMREGADWPFRAPDELRSPADTVRSGGAGPMAPGSLRQVPLSNGTYSALSAGDKRLFFLARKAEGPGFDLRALDLKYDAKTITLVEGVSSYELSLDGKKLMLRKGDDLSVIDASSGAGAKLEEAKVDLSAWKIPIDKAAEWQQIFVDAWRLHRDYFYDPNLHGVDWPAVRDQFAPLVDRVGAREELTDLQAQMVSFLSLMHSDAWGGDTRSGPDDILPGALGARFQRDPGAAGFRVTSVYQGDPGFPDALSPLAKPDVNILPGSIILAVNGESAAGAPDMGALLRGQAGKPVRLRVRDAAGAERDVVPTAISVAEEADLRYTEWEVTRRRAVEEMGNGSIGYVHLRAMGSSDIAQWTRDFFPVVNRSGLIIDVRHNRGGNIDSWVLGQLLRRAWMYWKGRDGDPYWNMQYAFRGHAVVLVNELTASDGEAFADGFRRLGLGDVIGTRTWGGEVWLSGSNRQVDGGVVRASETGVYGPEGEWLIEGWGVEPDLVVDNDPHGTYLGRDSQLEAAVAHLKRLIEEDPRPVPAPPPYPQVIEGQGYPVRR